MKPIITLILLLFINTICSQERISTILSEDTNAKYFVEEYNDKYYFLEFDSYDNLNVSILNKDYSLTNLHSRHFQGLSERYEFHINNNTIYIFDENTPVVYNFVEDTEARITIPSDFIPQDWVFYQDDLALIRASDLGNENFNNFLVSDKGEIIDDDESLKFVVNLLPNYYLKASIPVVGDNSYYIENIATGAKDTILNEVEKLVYSSQNNELVFIDNNGFFKRYNLINGEVVQVPNLQFLLEDVWRIKVLNDFIMVYEVDFGTRNLHVYDINTGDLIHVFTHEDLSNFDMDEAYIAQNKIIVIGRDLYIFDLDSGQTSIFPSNYSDFFEESQAPLLEDRYVLNINSIQVSLIDLTDLSEEVLSNEYAISPTVYVKMVPMDNSYLGIFSSFASQPKSVFAIDINQGSVTHVSSIDNTSAGLNNNAEVLNLNGNIILATDDIYSVFESEIEKVNPFELREIDFKTFRVHKENITFIGIEENVGRHLYSYDGTDLIEHALIPYNFAIPIDRQRIVDYAITEDNVYFIESYLPDTKLFSYTKSTGEVFEFTEAGTTFLEDDLYQAGEDVYLSMSEEVYHMQGDSMIMVKKEGTGILSSKAVVCTSENCYSVGPFTLNILKGDTLKTIYDGQVFFTISMLSSTLTDKFLVRVRDSFVERIALLVDGESTMEFEFDYRINQMIDIDRDHFLIETRNGNTNEYRSYVINVEDKELYEIPSFIGDYEVYDLVFRSEDPYLVARNSIDRKIKFYKLDEDFSNPTLVYTTNFNGGLYEARIAEIDDVGFLYANKTIAFIKDEFDVEKLDLNGGWGPEFGVNEDGIIYFIANDIQYGNQLFRINPLDFTFNVEENDVKSNLTIFPNPAIDRLYFESHLFNSNFEIIDTQGIPIINGRLSNSSLDISQLKAGVYFISIYNDKEFQTGPFIKL